METSDLQPANPEWQPLTRIQRRVAGVLIEKSKTTPDVYPMSLNGIKTGANQKSNRSPKMELEEHQVEDTLYALRQLGAAIEIHSGGRVAKFKHQMYDWLGTDKAELAVMGELLLRGEQTVGELRARAARMEQSISGMPELKPILASLLEKNLIVELTPAGRGQTITHNLYQTDELERLKKQFGTQSGGGSSSPRTEAPSTPSSTPSSTPASMPASTPASTPAATPASATIANPAPTITHPTIEVPASEDGSTKFEVRISQLESDVERLTSQLNSLTNEFHELKALIES